jgi:hypothetical protein
MIVTGLTTSQAVVAGDVNKLDAGVLISLSLYDVPTFTLTLTTNACELVKPDRNCHKISVRVSRFSKEEERSSPDRH